MNPQLPNLLAGTRAWSKGAANALSGQMGPASKLKNKNKIKRQQQQAASSSSDGSGSAAAAAAATAAAAGSGDLVALILSRLPIRNLVQCSTVCRLWREISLSSSVRSASLAGDRSWLLLHKRGWSRHGGDRLVAYSPAGDSWFELGSLGSLLRSGACWNRADHLASAAGLVCCAYREQQQLAVFNPLAMASSKRLLFLASSITAFEAVAMWGAAADECYGVLVAGPVSMWGSSWEVCVFDSRSGGSWTKSTTDVDAITQGRGFLCLLCSVVVADDDHRRSLFCIWGTSSVPQIITSYSIGLGSWSMLHDFFPFSWQCVAIRLGKWRFKAQVRPNLLDCAGKLVSISLRDESSLQVWQLVMNPTEGEMATWIELSAMPQDIWSAFCAEIGSSSSSSSRSEIQEWSLHVTAVGGGDLIYMVMDWGWRIRVLLHSLRSRSWIWLPDDVDERFNCRIDNAMICFDPKTVA